MTPLIYNVRDGANSASPIVFLVHGRAGNISVMSTFDRSVPNDWHRVYLQAPFVDPIGGFSWWDINDSERRDQQRSDSQAMLSEFVLGYSKRHHLQPQRLLAFGFSQGAAILSSVVQRFPDALQGVAFLSGFIFIEEIGVHRSLPRVFIAHGSEDTVVPPAKIEKGIEHLRAQGYPIEYVTEAVGHKVGIQGMRALKDWVSKNF